MLWKVLIMSKGFYLILAVMTLIGLLLTSCDNENTSSAADSSENYSVVSEYSEVQSETVSEVDSSVASDTESSEISIAESSHISVAESNEIESKTESTAVSEAVSDATSSATQNTTSKDTTSKDTTSKDTSSAVSEVESKPEPPVIKAVKVPVIYITTTENINRDFYVSAGLRVVDQENIFKEIKDTDGEVRVRGNSTSSGAKKPYNIKFSESQTLLGLGTAKKWVLLANMYDKTLIRNKLCFDFSTFIGMDYVSSNAFIDVYVNNVYMGNYLLTEAVDTGDTRVDIDDKDNEFLFEYEPWEQYSNEESIRTPKYNILLGFNAPEHPTPEQRAFLEDFLLNAENAIETKNLNEIKKYFDLESMVDFYIVNELFKNVDFATSSTRFYLKNGKIYGGPIWDMDLSTGNCFDGYYVEYNNVGSSGDSSESFYCQKLWYKYLFKCTGFVDMVKMRYFELQAYINNLTTDNSLGKNKIDTLLIKYGSSFDANYKLAGWSMTAKYSEFERVPFDTYDKNIVYLREWIIKRNNWLLKEWNLK